MTAPLVHTYGVVAPGEFLATFSSSGFLEISRRESNAAAHLETTPGMPVSVTKA
jgi:S-adenosylmethionine hydrolase